MKTEKDRKTNLLTVNGDGEWGEAGGGGAKSYDSEKAWPSNNHSILSAVGNTYCGY
jgi:hypothetical protein